MTPKLYSVVGVRESPTGLAQHIVIEAEGVILNFTDINGRATKVGQPYTYDKSRTNYFVSGPTYAKVISVANGIVTSRRKVANC